MGIYFDLSDGKLLKPGDLPEIFQLNIGKLTFPAAHTAGKR